MSGGTTAASARVTATAKRFTSPSYSFVGIVLLDLTKRLRRTRVVVVVVVVVAVARVFGRRRRRRCRRLGGVRRTSSAARRRWEWLERQRHRLIFVELD